MSEETIATNLRRLRSAQGLTQEELARRADLSPAGYRKVELGDSLPRSDTLQALADALDVGIRELVRPFSGSGPDRPSPSDFAEVRRAVEEEQITLSRGAEILGLSLNDMRQLAQSWAELDISPYRLGPTEEPRCP